MKRGDTLTALQKNDWKYWKHGFPYKGLNDPKYIKDKEKLFKSSGNGWWWEWTKYNTPIPGIYSTKSKEDEHHGKEKE